MYTFYIFVKVILETKLEIRNVTKRFKCRNVLTVNETENLSANAGRPGVKIL